MDEMDPIIIRAQGETQMQTQEADGRATIFIITKGVGKGRYRELAQTGTERQETHG